MIKLDITKCNYSNERLINKIIIELQSPQQINSKNELSNASYRNVYRPNITTPYRHTNSQPAYFSTIDLKYAYSRLHLHKDTAKHFNFIITCRESTGTYRFKTRFYVLTHMLAEFPRAMDYTLVGPQNTYCFLDDIIIVNTGSDFDQLRYVIKCLKKLIYDKFRFNLRKCLSAKAEIEWLGYNFSQTGISPLENKTAAILAILPPSTLKCLRSFLGSVHYLSNFIPNLAKFFHPSRPLLKKSTKFLWTELKFHTL